MPNERHLDAWGFQRPRPPGAARFLHGASFSFPSGHALGSVIGFGMLAYLLAGFWSPARRHRFLVAATADLLVLAIGLSRLYLVVHYLSDVIAGYAAGLVWLAACITGVEIALRQRGLDSWSVGADRRSSPREPGEQAVG
ncbi:MAG TPA: phosphatase PAP2 family protein [Gemmatimonadaceae bacterium]|nr:phosphatase PAP2 family protein [Gemmatimonadaceae bacterium]